MQLAVNIINTIWTIITYLVIYKTLYAIIGFFATRRFPQAKNLHKYAVMIAARNEEPVITKLIESIRRQDYPSDLITIFVVADNCTDDTAAAARRAGAIVYERADPDHRTKGYALKFLMENIRHDYGIDAFEGYFVFDADNLLKGDFVSRMNDAFDSGEKLITSFRNTKNFPDNWISATYGIHWYRTVRTDHRARSVLRLATRIQGTGFLVASEILKDGWNYVSLTEDRELSAYAALNGYRITYNDAAEFYDEQPTSVRIMLRQRLRWGKGHLWAFKEYGPKLLMATFKRRSFICYDMFWTIVPVNMFSFARRLSVLILSIAIVLQSGGGIAPIGALFKGYLLAAAQGMLGAIGAAVYTIFMERRRIPRTSLKKLAFYCTAFCLFDKIGLWATCAALFTKVEWKPIPHTVSKGIDELDRK